MSKTGDAAARIVKEMAEATGASQEDCRIQLQLSNGDPNRATEQLLSNPFSTVSDKKKKKEATAQARAEQPRGGRGSSMNGGAGGFGGPGGAGGRGGRGMNGGGRGAGGGGARFGSAPSRPAASTGRFGDGGGTAAAASAAGFGSSSSGMFGEETPSVSNGGGGGSAWGAAAPVAEPAAVSSSGGGGWGAPAAVAAPTTDASGKPLSMAERLRASLNPQPVPSPPSPAQQQQYAAAEEQQQPQQQQQQQDLGGWDAAVDQQPVEAHHQHQLHPQAVEPTGWDVGDTAGSGWDAAAAGAPQQEPTVGTSDWDAPAPEQQQQQQQPQPQQQQDYAPSAWGASAGKSIMSSLHAAKAAASAAHDQTLSAADNVAAPPPSNTGQYTAYGSAPGIASEPKSGSDVDAMQLAFGSFGLNPGTSYSGDFGPNFGGHNASLLSQQQPQQSQQQQPQQPQQETISPAVPAPAPASADSMYKPSPYSAAYGAFQQASEEKPAGSAPEPSRAGVPAHAFSTSQFSAPFGGFAGTAGPDVSQQPGYDAAQQAFANYPNHQQAAPTPPSMPSADVLKGASAYGTNPAAAAYGGGAYGNPAVSAPAYNASAQKYAYSQPPVSAPPLPDTSAAQMASASAAPPAAMPQAGSQVPQLAAQMPGGFGAPGMPSLNAYGTPYNAAYSTPYGQFTAPNPSLAYAMYSAGGMGYPGAFNSAMPPYPQMGEGGYPQASSYPAPASSAYSAPQRGYAPPAYNAGAAPAPSAYGGLGGGAYDELTSTTLATKDKQDQAMASMGMATGMGGYGGMGTQGPISSVPMSTYGAPPLSGAPGTGPSGGYGGGRGSGYQGQRGGRSNGQGYGGYGNSGSGGYGRNQPQGYAGGGYGQPAYGGAPNNYLGKQGY